MEVKDLELEKLKEEIAKLKSERQSTWHKYLFEAVRTILVFTGSVAVFFWIQKPESEVGRQATKAEVASARLETFQKIQSIKDTNVRAAAYQAYAAAHGNASYYVGFLESQAQLTKVLAESVDATGHAELLEVAQERENILLETSKAAAKLDISVPRDAQGHLVAASIDLLPIYLTEIDRLNSEAYEILLKL